MPWSPLDIFITAERSYCLSKPRSSPTIIGTKLFAFLLRLLGIGLAQFPTTHRPPQPTRVFFEKSRPRQQFLANELDHSTIIHAIIFFSSLRARNRIDRIRNPNPKFRVSVSFNSPVIPILTDAMAIRSRRFADKRDSFIKSSRPCRFSIPLLSFFKFPATMMIHAEISRLD